MASAVAYFVLLSFPESAVLGTAPILSLAGPFLGGIFAGWFIGSNGPRNGALSALLAVSVELYRQVIAYLSYVRVDAAMRAKAGVPAQTGEHFAAVLLRNAVGRLLVTLVLWIIAAYFGGRMGQKMAEKS